MSDWWREPGDLLLDILRAHCTRDEAVALSAGGTGSYYREAEPPRPLHGARRKETE